MPVISKILLFSCATSAVSVIITQDPIRTTTLGLDNSSGASALAANHSHLLASEPHSAEYFADQCTAIKLKCQKRKQEVEDTQAEEEMQLQRRYKHEKDILDEAQGSASQQREHVREQRAAVRASKKEVEEATSVYERTKSCPEEHRKLVRELEDLQAEPNDSDEDIDAECQKKKDILQKGKCVDEHVEAQDTLSRSEAAYSEESETYSSHKASAKAAEQDVEPYKRRTAEAKEALDAERQNGAKDQLNQIDKSCHDELDALERESKQEVDEAFRRYALARDRLRHGKHEYHEEKEDVKDQKEDVKEDKERVEAAKAFYEKHKDCPKELRQAEKELAELEAVPNQSDEDIDAECMKKKEVLVKQRCVDRFVKARSVLSRRERAYAEEKTELKEEKGEKHDAKQTMKQMTEVMQQYQDAWKAAQSAEKELHKCTGTPIGKLPPNEAAPYKALKTTLEGIPTAPKGRATCTDSSFLAFVLLLAPAALRG